MNAMKIGSYVILFLAVIGTVCVPSGAQIPHIKIPKIPSIPNNPLGNHAAGLPFNLKGEDPISTSFADTDKTVTLPDNFAPKTYKSLFSLRTSPQGGFLLQPGAYETVVESFCLHAGTHGPSGGNGYLYAPLKGSKAAIIHSILRGVGQHREIPQSQVQTLIWAIEARARFEDLSPALQLAAAKLLTKKELLELDGGALGLVSGPLWEKALGSAPPEARKLLEIQAEIRRKLANANTTFAELERLAVLSGPPEHNGVTIPRGRWSSHPGGFFVRYLPDGYTKVKIQIYVPGEHAQRSDQPAGTIALTTVSLRAVEFDPTEDVAVPADTGAQRLGLSDVPLSSGDGRQGHYGQADGSTQREACEKATNECTSSLNCAAGSKIQILGGKDCAGNCYAGGTLGWTCQRVCKCVSSGPPVSLLEPKVLDVWPAF
jgi:hypothetical protein